MTIGMLMLILASLVGLVAGQVLLKFAMRHAPPRDPSKPPRIRHHRLWLLAAGIAAMTIWFMLWLGLLQQLDLSHLFPFEGLATVMLSVAAARLLKERITARMWAAIAIISAGVVLVGLSAPAKPRPAGPPPGDASAGSR